MKKLTIILSLILSATFSFAQFDEPCLPHGIHFSNQQQIDNFQTDYPDCQTIGGNVFVTWGSDITNLNGLNVLTSIGGSLTIGGNGLLTDLTGLENLTSIGGNLSLYCLIEWGDLTGNPLLTSLNGLNNLKSIGGDFKVISNKSLVNFSGLENLDSIQGSLIIGKMEGKDNNGIVSLEGLDNLVYVGGDLSIAYNDSLTSLNSLDNLAVDSIKNLFIHDNVSLSECNSQAICNYLSNPNGIVEIHHNATGCNSPGEIAEGCGITLPCLPYGNYYFSSQDDIDNFQTDYPDCYGLIGDVIIAGDDISNLNGLNMVSSIDGDLRIYDYRSNNPLLRNLQGLENLTSIGGWLDITYNDSLTSLSGLENVNTIGGGLRISGNPLLSNCEAEGICAYLSDPNGYIDISGNATGCSSMFEVAVACGTTIPCFDEQSYSLKSQFDVDHFPVVFPGCTDILTSVYMFGDDIVNLDSLNMITSIGGGLSIRDNTALTSLIGLENLSSIGGALYIYNNDTLNSLTGLDNLSSIGGSLLIGYMYGNDYLTSLTGLGNLSSIGGEFRVENNIALTSMMGLENLSSIGGSFTIINNDSLTSLTNFENLSSIGGTFTIQENNALTSLTGLENLSTIGGALYIYNNDTLTSLTGMEGLTIIGGEFFIEGNSALVSLSGLENLTTIKWNLNITANNALTSLTGLENLTSIDGSLFIGKVWGNNALTSLTGLENLSSIGGDLSIRYNNSLTTLTGLENLTSIGGDLQIRSNPLLSICEAEGICSYLSDPNGVIKIYDNAPGCNSQQEVQEACWIVHIEDGQASENQFAFYPNPVTANAKLSGEFASSKTINICIYNTTGLCLKSWEFASQQSGKQEFTLNLNDLPPGIYFLRMQAGNELMTKKIVKL